MDFRADGPENVVNIKRVVRITSCFVCTKKTIFSCFTVVEFTTYFGILHNKEVNSLLNTFSFLQYAAAAWKIRTSISRTPTAPISPKTPRWQTSGSGLFG